MGEIIKRMENLHTRLSNIRKDLRNRPYPFDHADESMDLQQFVIPELPEDDDLGGIMNVTSHAFERLFMVQVRMYARLAFAADKVETALGLPPLEDPDDAEKKKVKSDGAEPAMKKTGTFAASGGGSASSPTAPKPGSTKPASKPEPKLPPKTG